MTSTSILVLDLRASLAMGGRAAEQRGRLGEHLATRVSGSVLLTRPSDTALAGQALVQTSANLAALACSATPGRAEVCPHAALLADVAGYAGLTLIDRAQEATA